ncbi:MAG: dihydrofolate reductase family protein [Gemmatimonadaceae bacterium]
MRLALFMHVSLDGFVAGPNGEMDWITVTPDVFELAGQRSRSADTALYGRRTYEMMDAYWPTAGTPANASKHDKEHSAWYNGAHKVVVSRSLQGQQRPQTTFVGRDLAAEVQAIKEGPGTGIVMFGSVSVAHALTKYHLIDDYWLMLNPVLLGGGLPLFADLSERTKLTAASSTLLSSGVVALHYQADSVSR